MNYIIEAMIKGHDKTEYRWVSGKCKNKCFVCDSNNNSVKPMQVWLAEGLPQALGKLKYPEIEHYKRAWQLYYETGCRLSEPFMGKLDGNWLIVDVENSKTHIQREIYLSKELIDTLEEMQQRMVIYLQCNKSKRDFIKRYSRVFKECCKMVGINDKHFHHIRHTYAVRRYLEVRDIYKVAKELGHSSVTTTEIYAKFNLSRLEQDFPGLTNSGKKDVFKAKYGIRDTDFRDTLNINSGIARG